MRRCWEVVKAHTMKTLKARSRARSMRLSRCSWRPFDELAAALKRSEPTRQDARDAMEKSYAAVPCWIMLTWRVSESLPATLESFDVVIFDEASSPTSRRRLHSCAARRYSLSATTNRLAHWRSGIEERQLRFLRMQLSRGQYFAA